MAPQRYHRVSTADHATGHPKRHLQFPAVTDSMRQVAEQNDDDLPITENELHHQIAIPSSPPPSFRSRASSRRGSASHAATETDVERSLDDAFGGSHDSDDEDDNEESRRLVSRANSETPPRPGNMARRTTEFPSAPAGTRPVFGGGSSTRDGVFANISAKPSRHDDLEEKPPVSASCSESSCRIVY